MRLICSWREKKGKDTQGEVEGEGPEGGEQFEAFARALEDGEGEEQAA